jgi:hypothetical protein
MEPTSGELLNTDMSAGKKGLNAVDAAVPGFLGPVFREAEPAKMPFYITV